MLANAISRIANHLLAPANWARAELLPHAGKAARFELGAARFTVQVGEEGLLGPAAEGTVPDVHIRFQAGAVLRTLADRQQAWRGASIEGDAEFASSISRVAANIEWDLEEDLSRVVGDIAAHRLAQAGRSAAAWPRQVAQSLAANASEYFTEEAKLLVTPLQAAEFVREVDELRDAVERLEKRIDRLSRGR